MIHRVQQEHLVTLVPQDEREYQEILCVCKSVNLHCILCNNVQSTQGEIGMQGPTGAPGEPGEPVSNCKDLMRHVILYLLYRVQLVHQEEKVNLEKKEILEIQ